MHLLTLVFGIGLLPSAFTLKCYDCSSSGTCTDTQTEAECPAQGYQCGTQLVAIYANGTKIVNHKKSCVLPEECIESSVNFGAARTVIITKCCTSDLCNGQPASEYEALIPNGKKCFSCGDTTCSATLNCEGNEDHCVSATVTFGAEKTIMKGCATERMCSTSASVQANGALGGGITCCLGDFCNSATTISAGLVLFMAPLVTLIMLS